MTNIVLLGMNHKTATVEVREQLALACQQVVSPLQLMHHLDHVNELYFLSTCNRVEFLFTCLDKNRAVREVKVQLGSHLGGTASTRLETFIYQHEQMDAVRHLFRVAASLD